MSGSEKSRRTDVELFRVLACLGIVYFHAGVFSGISNAIAYSGLIIFVLISVFYNGKRKKTDEISSLAKKILVPYFIWSAIYLVLYLISGKSISEIISLKTVISGTSIHLWYLPFIFLVLVIVGQIKNKIPLKVISGASGTMFLFWLYFSPFWRSCVEVVPFPQYMHAVGGVFLALSVVSSVRCISYASLVGGVLMCMYLLQFKDYGISVVYLISAFFTFTLITRPVSLSIVAKPVALLSSLTFSIYLVHPLGLAILSKLNFGGDFFTPALVFIGSGVGIWVFRRFTPARYNQWLLP